MIKHTQLSIASSDTPDHKERGEETSVDLIYPLALASYEEAQKRLDVIDKRIQELLAFAITITLGVITISVGKHADFGAPLFIIAMIVGLIGIGIGIYARIEGYLKLIHISTLYEKCLDASPMEFKRNFIRYAGVHSDFNGKLVKRKGHFTSAAVIGFLIEAVLLGIWAVLPVPPSATHQSPHPVQASQVGQSQQVPVKEKATGK